MVVNMGLLPRVSLLLEQKGGRFCGPAVVSDNRAVRACSIYERCCILATFETFRLSECVNKSGCFFSIWAFCVIYARVW